MPNAFEGESEVFQQYLAGQVACLRELADLPGPDGELLQALRRRSWAPTTLAWGRDNRTCGFRVVGHGQALRTETRIPGGDVNPYLAFAALLAAGLDGIEHGLALPPPLEGNAYESDAELFPSRCTRQSRRSSRGPSHGMRSATTSSTTTSTTRAQSSPLRRGRHGLRARAALRAGIDDRSEIDRQPWHRRMAADTVARSHARASRVSADTHEE